MNQSMTYRDRVPLPPMPDEYEAGLRYPPANLERAQVRAGELVFDREDGLQRACAQGFFLVGIPEGVNTDPGDTLAAEFHRDRTGDHLDPFRGWRDVEIPGDYQGYFDREHDQWENLYVESANWHLLPPGVAPLGHAMTDLGLLVLCSVLRGVGIPRDAWATVTSALSEKRGHQMLAFNHFRSTKDTRGSKFHRDSGWVTVLRSTEPGLLALIDGELRSVDPVPGYFIVNFGSSLEVLTERLPAPVRANVHGVAHTRRAPGTPDRTSYAIFLDSALGGTIHRWEDNTAHPVQSVAEFAEQEVNRTYDDTTDL